MAGIPEKDAPPSQENGGFTALPRLDWKDTSHVQLKHAAAKTHAVFDEPNLAPRAGLIPVMRLAEHAGLPALVREHVHPAGQTGANAEIILSSTDDQGCDLGVRVEDGVADADTRDRFLLVSRARSLSENFSGRVWVVGWLCVRWPRSVGRRVRGRVGGAGAGCPRSTPGCGRGRSRGGREGMPRRCVGWRGRVGGRGSPGGLAEAFNLGAQVGLGVEPGPRDPGFSELR